MKFSVKTVLFSLCIVAFVLLGAYGIWNSVLAKTGASTIAQTLVIPAGQSAKTIGLRLEKMGVINSASVFYWHTKLTGIAPKLHAGEYTFPAGVSTKEVINRLTQGKTQNRTITFIEGLTTADFVRKLAENDAFTGDIPKTKAEGSLFPDTYHFTYGEKRKKMLQKMRTRAENELAKAWEGRDKTLPLKTPTELLILASIIQKEAGNTAEMPTISGVFINRLNKSMLLQTDPTIIYGLMVQGKYNGNITRAHLREDTPYNTYIHKGLPPTPIANVGKAALQAAAHPQVHNYLFFVASGTGGHYFAKTYSQHKQNVQKYLKIYRKQRRDARAKQ